MQLLTFKACGHAYAIDSKAVVEVLPQVPVRAMPRLPDYIVGMFNYRGKMIPVVDLTRRLSDRFAAERLSTRVIVVEYGIPEGHVDSPRFRQVRMGLMAEDVISTQSSKDADTAFPTMHLEIAPFLGRIVRLNGETIQVVIVEKLLPTDIAAGLFTDAAALHSQ